MALNIFIIYEKYIDKCTNHKCISRNPYKVPPFLQPDHKMIKNMQNMIHPLPSSCYPLVRSYLVLKGNHFLTSTT